MITYVPEVNMESLRKFLSMAEKKAVRYGMEFSYSIGEPEIREVLMEGNMKGYMKFYPVEVKGTVRHEGWTVLAKIEHHFVNGNYENVVYLFSNISKKEWWNLPPKCDHCNSNRGRKDTFIVYHEGMKKMKQIGSSCLREFTGGLDPEKALRMAEIISESDGYCGFDNSPTSCYYDLRTVLCGYAKCIKERGYHKSGTEESTKVAGISYWVNGEGKEFSNEVEDMIDFAKNPKEENEFTMNLRSICSSDYVQFKNIGFIACLPYIYWRNKEREQELAIRKEKHEKEVETSRHLYQKGDKIQIHVTVTKVVGFETKYGYSTVFKMVDDEGNVYSWITSSCAEFSVGDEMIIQASVKENKEYDGVKETALLRVKKVA